MTEKGNEITYRIPYCKEDLVIYPMMSLRDWFAGQMLAGICANPDCGNPDITAEYCYRVADAMLAERGDK